MEFIDEQLLKFKNMIEQSIIEGGAKGKTSAIRSSQLINLIHDAVKFELKWAGVNSDLIFPHFNEKKPEIKLAGFLKQKNQDVCVVPNNINKVPVTVNWGPMAFLNKIDEYGYEYSNNTLVINVRSQMSSIAKNTDTLFERTFAEALNLHMRYPDMVLGEVYLIPVFEYDDSAVENHIVAFKTHRTDLEKYISFFDSINNRDKNDKPYKYERVALLIVDFRSEIPKLFKTSEELKKEGFISESFNIEYSTLSFDNFARDIIQIYASRFKIANLK